MFGKGFFEHPFSYLSTPTILSETRISMVMILILVGAEIFQRKKRDVLEIASLPAGLRWYIYYILVFTILSCFQADKQFIYFQF